MGSQVFLSCFLPFQSRETTGHQYSLNNFGPMVLTTLCAKNAGVDGKIQSVCSLSSSQFSRGNTVMEICAVLGDWVSEPIPQLVAPA